VPIMFQQHTRMSSEGSAREQENPEVHGGVGLANQSGSAVSSQGSTTSSSSYLSSIVRARTQHLKKAREPSRRALLISDPVHRRNSLFACSSPQPKLPQGLPDSLNLPNAGDSFAGTSPLSSYFLFSPTKDLIALIWKVLGCSL
jgi:hypothetical protein